jgi:hypothetical protein
MNNFLPDRAIQRRVPIFLRVGIAGWLCVAAGLHAQDEVPLRKPSPPKLPAAYPEIVLPEGPGPHFYLNTEEVSRLKVAYEGEGEAAKSLAKIVSQARSELERPFSFPPRGGLHGSLYHCPDCQRKLKPVLDESKQIKHHRCGKCDKRLTGFPYDDVYYTTAHSQNFKRGLLAAKAYTLTDEDKFAVFVRDLLVGYADRYVGYKRTEGILSSGRYGHICSTDHEAGSLMMRYLGPMYDMVGHHSAFSSDDQRHIKSDMIKPMMTYFDTATMRGKSNHHSFHNAGYIWGGVLTGDKIRVAQAIYGTGGGFIEQVRTAPSREGLWPGGYSYHFYARRALVRTAEVARHIDIDLYAEPQFKKMFFLPAKEVMPDGFTPNFGDDPGKYVVGRLGSEEGYAAYKDSALIPLLATADSWESILAGRTKPLQPVEFRNESILLPDSGHAILRGRAPANFVLALQFGKYGTSHTHFDKLSYILYGNYQQLALDSGKRNSVDYESDVHQAYYKGTIGHNAIVVDGHSQQKNKNNCELLEFEAQGVIPYVGVSSSELYDGVGQSRWLAVAPEYVLVLDKLHSKEVHVYDWWHHCKGEKGTVNQAHSVGQPRQESVDPGLRYIADIKRGNASGDLTWQVARKTGRLRLTLASGGETNVLTGTGPLTSLDRRVPAVRFTRKGKDVTFVAGLEFVEQNKAPFVSDIQVDVSEGKTIVTVNYENGNDRFVLSDRHFLVVDGPRTTGDRD